MTAPPHLAHLRTLLALALALLALTAPPARAADPDDPVISAVVGWKGVLVPERWCPVRVTITGPGRGPILEAMDAVLTISYLQDATQESRITQRVTLTPGRTLDVHAAICIPRFAPRLRITLSTPRGRVLSSINYSEAVSRPDDVPLPPILDIGALACLRVVKLGDNTREVPAQTLAAFQPASGFSGANQFSTLVESRPADLPQQSAAYEGLGVLVIHADAEVDRRAQAAIGEWVLSGGRLVVISERTADSWRAWLPPGPAGELVESRPPEPLSLPGEVISALARSVKPPPPTFVAPPVPGESLSGQTPSSSEPLETASFSQAPLGSIRARLFTLTGLGAAQGWSLRWLDPAGGGLLAEGPVGYGFVTILALEPAAFVASRTDADAAGLWADAFSTALRDQTPSRDDQNVGGWGYAESSGHTHKAQQSLASILDLMANVTPVDLPIFIALFIAIALLAILVGPGDFLLLRRRARRHLSWLTALIWISISGAAAFVGPVLLRGSDSRIARLSVIDAILPAAGGDAPPLAYHATVSQVWSGRTEDLSTLAADARPAVLAPSDGSRWRGVSSMTLSRWESQPITVPVSFVQRPSSIDAGADALGGLTPAQDSSTIPAPSGLALRRWTLRSFMDSGRTTLPLQAELIPPAGLRDPWRVRLTLPNSARVDAASLRTPSGWIDLTFAPRPDSPAGPRTQQLEATIADLPGRTGGVGGEAGALFRVNRSAQSAVGHSGTQPYVPGAVFDLPGPAERTLAIDRRIASGSHAALHLAVDGLPPDVAWSAPIEDLSRRAVLRILLPLPEEARPNPPNPPGQPEPAGSQVPRKPRSRRSS